LVLLKIEKSDAALGAGRVGSGGGVAATQNHKRN
jgi:hypothetical protein